MFAVSLRWIVASAAAVLLLGVGLAFWLTSVKTPEPLPDDEKFVLENVLGDDGRIGKVTDAQGIVSVKPVLHDRWTPVQPRLVLKPGDLIRTDSRGANAVALKLLKATSVIVGPHSTVELMKANEIRLTAGEVEIVAAADAPVAAPRPGQGKAAREGERTLPCREGQARPNPEGTGMAAGLQGHHRERVHWLAHCHRRRPQCAADSGVPPRHR
ncbi:MAG: hypothetical protein U0792_02835 [Gemmataceae bacterium]